MKAENKVQVRGRVRRLRPVSSTYLRPGIRDIRSLPMPKPVIRTAAPTKPSSTLVSPLAIGEVSGHWAHAPGRSGADPDILVVEDVARILRCTVDTARRIPRDQLRSISGPGRPQLYLREDVIAYVRSRARQPPNADLLLAQARAAVVELPADRVRERSQRRRTS